MILELTEKEQTVLLGLLEDISQAEDVNNVFPVQDRIALISIIQKLGGTYFGKIEIAKYRLSSIYGRMVSEDNNG
jgi:hypothetical protein